MPHRHPTQWHPTQWLVLIQYLVACMELGQIIPCVAVQGVPFPRAAVMKMLMRNTYIRRIMAPVGIYYSSLEQLALTKT